ncbi:remodeling and spacing factor 1 [Trichonephila clavata]|uniref:Remodeling and spacing factor 1 n=1 Tax=Trichonephila clavata TaxID=2740835 RepID=A0A8X6FQ37_TRICU|nr:remodeling and spacing factor 1 [Trichonephila clavata]
MAASEESCDGNPDFAVICSFISKFGDDCGVNVTIPCLQQMLEDTKNVHEELAELHIHLLRRGRKRVTKERWEKSLIKFCHEYSSVDAWELERFGYKKAKLSVKLEILKRLLELQFDSNPKFKTEVNKQDAHSLRIPPIGRDIDGQVYWYQLDKEYNMRLYRQGVGDESAWTLLCSTTDHLKNLLCSLEKNITNTTPQASEAATKEEKVDPAVPKQEKEGEDLTSCMSQTKPCAIIIKTEKKDLLSTYKVTSTLKTPVKADTTTDPEIDKEAPSEISSSEQETKVKECPDNQKEIKTDDIVKKEVDSSKKEDVTPLEIVDGKDKVNDHSEIAPKMDVEITNIEDVPLIDKKSKLSENTFDRKTNMNVPDIIKNSSTQEIMPEAKFKDSKIKLYEKWSNEKKQAAAAVNESTEEKKQISSTTNHQELIDSKESLPEDLTVSHKALSENSTNKSNPVKISSNEPLCDTVSRGDEVPMDLSVSCRNNDSVSKNSATDVSSNNKKRTLSDLEKTNLSYNGGSGRPSFPISDHCKTIDLKYSNTSEAPRPFKKKHLSMTKEEPVKETGDHGRKSVIFEVKNSKLFNQYQENRHSSDPIISDRTQTNSGFSHLQALQNMCNENPMTCFQSNIINSAGQDKRPPIEGSYGKYGLEKFSYNETACDNLSKKYAFSSSQLSDDMKHISDKIEPAPLLKSNLQGGSEIPPRDHPQSKSTICSSPLIAENKKSIVKDEKSGHPIKKSNHVETVPSSTFSASNVEKVEKQKVVDRCTKTLNQNAPVVAEGNRASIKEHVKVKKEKHSDNLAEPTSKGRFSKPCEDITECSKVKHTVTSMLRQDVVTSKSNDLMCSSIANKPSIVPSLSTSNESNKSFISESETDTNVTHIASSKDKLHKSDEKDNKNSNLVKNELNDNSLGHVQDNNIPPKSVKQEIPQPLPSEKLEPPIIPEVCTKPEKTLLDSSEPMDVDNKSSIVTSKSTDVPSSVIGKNSETVEQMHIPAVSNKEPVKSSSEHNQLSNSCKNSSSDTSTFSASAISKSDSIKSVKDKSEHVITNVLSTPLVKPKEEINHDNRGSNNNLKNKELLTDTKTVSIDSKTMNTDVAVPKQKIGEISENVESISDSTSLKSESTTVPYKTEKCDKENSVDTLKNELNDPNNCNTIGQQVFTSCSVKLNDSSLSLEQNQNVSIEKNVGHRNIVTSAVNNLDTREKEVCCLTTVGELNVKTEESSLLNAEPGKNSSDGSLSKTGILITTENRSLENSISDKIIETKHKSSGESELMCLDNPTKICVETGSGVNAKVNSKETSEESAKKLQSDKSKIKTLEVVVDSPVEKTICEFKKNPEKSEIDVKKDYSSIAEILDETKIAYKKKSNIEISATKVLTNRSPCETGKKSPAKLDTSTSNALLNESENKMNELVGGKELPETKITPKSETPVNIPSPELLINETEIKASGKLEAEGNSSSSIGNSQTKVTKKIAENSEAATALTSRDAVKTECDVEFNEVPSNVKKSLDKKGNKSSDNCVKISADKNSSNVPKSAKMTEIDAVHLKNKTSVKTENVKDSSQSDRLIPECQTTQAEVSEVPIKTKSETVVQSLKMKDLSQESAAKQSAKEMSKKVKSKSSTNETIVDKQDKEICVKSKDNVPCSNLEGKNDLPQESVTKHIEKDTSKNTLKTSAEEVVTSEEKCKKSYKKSKIETDTEINSLNSPFKEVAKIEIPNLQQNISPVAPVKLEAKSSEIPQNDTSDKLLVKPALSVSVADENNLKESEVSKSVMNVKKAENDSNKNDTEPAQSDNKKNDQRISNKSTRSSRTKSRSKSNCKIEIGDSTPQDLLTKSELSVESSVKNETAKCKSSKKETELTKFIKNDKHISMEDIKPEVNKDSVTTSVGEKRIKPVEVKTEVSEKKSGEEMMFDFLCNLDIKNPLNLYLVMNSRCLETKGRHPHCGQLGMKPLPSTSPSKPKLITTFSLDTNDEVQIISSTGSPTKKKRGRLRQRGPVTKSKEPSPVPEPRKTPAKLPAQKRGRNSKKPSTTSGKDNFTIPEGFLEILSNSQSETTKAEPQRKSRGQKSKVSTPSLQSSESESAPIKRSRRIQEQHQKKMSELAVEMEREQRMLEQMAKKSAKKGSTPKSTPKAQEAKNSRATKSKFQPPTPEETLLESKRSTRKMNSRSRNMTKMTLMYEDESKDSEFSTSRETEKSKKRRRGKGARKGYKPWDVSSESSSSIEELTEEEEEEHEEPLVFEVNEDEFACEEVEEDAEPIVVRRARTAKKAPEDTTAEENVVIDDKPCSKCGKYDKPEWILLCDKCDNGYHTQCLIPPLVIIPEGDWYCQPCEHAFLCDVLQKELHRLELILKQREREELRKQRLAYVGISLDNVLKPVSIFTST